MSKLSPWAFKQSAGGGSIFGLFFLPDGSVTLRTGGIGVEATIRSAGTHLLTVGQKYMLELELAGTIARVYLDGTLIGTASGTNLKHDFTKLFEGGASNSGWIGKMYSAQYWENGTLIHQWRLSEGSGLAITDSVGSLNVTIGENLIWVNS